ncbi:hypothetical protein ACJ73_00948 [Blastomyces percursus]|uniref:Uncharacterized protein n=1 Tax=Blastomyces percursus TaxID=1658174 RepID=A0A1J9RI61_9EURO|nr:hypothetical protein ACJ73_00948 [Blastomyces percursus]
MNDPLSWNKLAVPSMLKEQLGSLVQNFKVDRYDVLSVAFQGYVRCHGHGEIPMLIGITPNSPSDMPIQMQRGNWQQAARKCNQMEGGEWNGMKRADDSAATNIVTAEPSYAQ